MPRILRTVYLRVLPVLQEVQVYTGGEAMSEREIALLTLGAFIGTFFTVTIRTAMGI